MAYAQMLWTMQWRWRKGDSMAGIDICIYLLIFSTLIVLPAQCQQYVNHFCMISACSSELRGSLSLEHVGLRPIAWCLKWLQLIFWASTLTVFQNLKTLGGNSNRKEYALHSN